MRWVAVALLSVASLASASAGEHDALVVKYAAANGVPEALVRRVIRIESRGNPRLVHAGNYGLMQIRLGTARTMGYAGDAKGLLDADTNLAYAVKYLAGAYRAAGCKEDRAIHYYQRGYHSVRQASCAPAVVPAPALQPKQVDVLKPRVVRVETIGAGGAPVGHLRSPARFEPARISAQPGVPNTEIAAVPIPLPAPAELRLVSIPLPSAQSDGSDVPKKLKDAKPAHRTSHKHAQPGARVQTAKAADNNDPIGVVALVKKIVAPGKSSGQATGVETPPLQSPAPPQ